MNKECEVIRDLLPLYADDVCSERSRELIEEHLHNCPECSAVLEKLRKNEIENNLKEEKDQVIEYQAKRFKRRSTTVGSVVSGLFMVPILICLIVNLASGHGLDWFFVVLAALGVTASLTVCIGAMAIMGAVQDGISGDWSTLGAKSILDLVIVMVMTCSLGKGCMFSAVPVFLWEGGLTLLATAIRPIMTDLAMGYLSMVGSVLIFCVGLNLIWGKKIRVANLLPAVVFAVVAAFLPIHF